MPGIRDGQWDYAETTGRHFDREKFEDCQTTLYPKGEVHRHTETLCFPASHPIGRLDEVLHLVIGAVLIEVEKPQPPDTRAKGKINGIGVTGMAPAPYVAIFVWCEFRIVD